MPHGIFINANTGQVNTKILGMYCVGSDGKARRIIKGYVGDSNNVAQIFYNYGNNTIGPYVDVRTTKGFAGANRFGACGTIYGKIAIHYGGLTRLNVEDSSENFHQKYDYIDEKLVQKTSGITGYPKICCAGAATKDYFYVAGGSTTLSGSNPATNLTAGISTSTKSVLRIDSAGTGLTTVSDLPVECTRLAGTTTHHGEYNDSCAVFGGGLMKNGYGSGHYFYYNNSGTRSSDFDITQSSSASTPSEAAFRWDLALCSHYRNGLIIAAGGYAKMQSGTYAEYTYLTQAWSAKNIGTRIRGISDLKGNLERKFIASAAVQSTRINDSTDTGYIIFLGGQQKNGSTACTYVDCFNSTGTRTDATALDTGVYLAKGVTLGRNAVFYGGKLSNGSETNLVHIIDPSLTRRTLSNASWTGCASNASVIEPFAIFSTSAENGSGLYFSDASEDHRYPDR